MDKKKKKYLYSLIEIGLVIAVTFVIFGYIVVPVRISGVSMENTLHNNNIALINATGINKENIKRFDVVVLYSEALNEKIIKRVIGMPGDTVEFKDDQLYINDEMVAQSFLDAAFVEESKVKYNTEKFTDDFKVKVEEDKYFVMGDNRLRSTDSRELGAFSLDDMIGVEGLVIYPFSEVQWLR